MGALLRRLRSCETGSALTEYTLMIAVLVLGLVAALGVFRNSVGQHDQPDFRHDLASVGSPLRLGRRCRGRSSHSCGPGPDRARSR